MAFVSRIVPRPFDFILDMSSALCLYTWSGLAQIMAIRCWSFSLPLEMKAEITQF